MVKYRIEYKRNLCIGAAVCVAYSEDDWEMNDDGLADLKDSTEKNGVFIKDIEGEFEMNKLGAEACPARVIQVTNLETGEVVVKFDC
jgi:ferredoxin